MPGREWDAKAKAEIVIQGLKGRSVSEICNEFQIRQNQYYKWRDQFLKGFPQLFESSSSREKSLIRENNHLKKIISDLTIELKKSDQEWLK